MGDCEQMLQSPFPAACDDVGFSQAAPQTAPAPLLSDHAHQNFL